MRRWLLGLLLLTGVAGCWQAAKPADTGTPPATTATGSVAVLTARPLKLPIVKPGAPCPVTPVVGTSVGVANPRGHGPFYLGGPMPAGAYPWNKTVYVVTGSPPAPGPLLFRGARIDGVGRLQFSGQPASASDKATYLTSGAGVGDFFYERVLQQSGGGALYVYPSTKGCYAIQVDAATFEDVIAVTAT